MPVPGWLHPPRYVLVLLLAVTGVPAAALIWVSWRVVEQDRALATQRLQERLEHAADVAVSSLHRRLADLDAQLAVFAAAAPTSLARDAVVLVARGGAVVPHPAGRLLWQPMADVAVDPSSAVWRAAERLEFQQRDYAGAAAEYRRLAGAADGAVRAGALVRLARTLRKAGRLGDARTAYRELARQGDITVGGAPATLVAAYGDALVLAELQRGTRTPEWQQAVDRLRADLYGSRWPIDRATFEFYAGELRGWLANDVGTRPEAVALSLAVDQAWELLHDAGTETDQGGRALVEAEARPFLVLWRASPPDARVMLVAGAEYAVGEWRADVEPRLSVDLTDAAGRPMLRQTAPPAKPVAVRSAADTGLPWSIRIASANPAADLAELSTPRRLLLTGLGLMGFLVSLGIYAVTRAVTRELAVARLQSNFVAAVSHEFRSPITALRHLTEMLAAGDVPSEARRDQYYAALARETERLHRVVDSLLDFGRMEAGRRQYRFEPLDAGALVDQVVDEFTADDERLARRVEVVDRIAAPTARGVHGDRGALARAVWNLIDNALKYSPSDTPVRVELERRNGHVLIHVTDRGPGIPASERAEIFDRFVRGRAASDTHAAGTGLGLAIVRHIARAHQGDVTLSTERREGSRFTIALPAREPRPS